MPTKLWTKDYSLALVVAFFVSMVFFLLMTTMVLYAVEEFGAGESLAGLAASIYVVGALFARLGAGVAVDALGRRRVLLVSLAAFAVLAAVYVLADGLAALLVLRFLHGAAFGMAHSAASAITQSLIPAQRRAEGTGYQGASATLATAIGPFVAVLLIQQGSYNGVFLAATVAAVLAFGAALALRAPGERTVPGATRPPGTGPAASARIVPTTAAAPAAATAPAPAAPAPAAAALAPTARVSRRSGPVELRALPISVFALVAALGYSGVLAFVNSYAVSLDLTHVAAVFFLVYALVVLVLRLFVGRLQDVHGDNVIVYPAVGLLAAGMVVLAFTGGAVMLLVAAGLIGAGWGTLMSASQAIAVGKAPITNVGKTVSTYYLFVDLGVGLGPVLLGALVGVTDYRSMYLVLAAVVVLSTGVYYAAHGRTAARARPRARVA